MLFVVRTAERNGWSMATVVGDLDLATLPALRTALDQLDGQCVGLDLSDVARGRFDGFWELFLNPWDLAAGVLLVREAGGRVTDLAGRDARLTGGPIVASNGMLHDWFLDLLNDPDDTTTVPAPDPA